MNWLQQALTPPRFLAAIAAFTVATIVGICVLPHDRHVRFNSLDHVHVVKAGWIYERIHFDRTPIDVAFIGTSRTLYGVNSRSVEESAARDGGRPLRVVNFGMHHLGRGMHYLIARELLRNRKIRLLVVEVQETETRAQHPAFYRLGDVSDVVGAPLVINTNYFSDLAQLPLRQLALFIRTLWPALYGDVPGFDLREYAGANWDDTEQGRGSLRHPATDLTPRKAIHTEEELQQQRHEAERRDAAKFALPAALRSLETRTTLIYLDKLTQVAREAGVPIQFIYLPSYGALPIPQFADVYRDHGPTWFAGEVFARTENWLDVNHLNQYGAGMLSEWIGRQLHEQKFD